MNVLLYFVTTVQMEGWDRTFSMLGGVLLSTAPALFAAHRRSQVMTHAVSMNQGDGSAAVFSLWSPGLKPSLAEVGFLRVEVTAGFAS